MGNDRVYSTASILSCSFLVLGIFRYKFAVADLWHSPTQVYCEVIDASVTHSSLDSFAEVSGGMITLRSPVKEAWRILDVQALAGFVPL